MNATDKKQNRISQWIEDRWPLKAVVRWGTVEEIPGGASFAYVLGSATLFLFGVLVVTGVWQLLYYVPTVDHAYDSVMFLRLHVPLGWLIHGLHYWAAQGFIVVMGLHLARVYIWAAYKQPRQLTWLAGVVLLLLGAAFIFTGAILPWDTLGYWAGEVGTSMAGTVPFIGTFLKLLMRGGATMDQLTLSRAFFVHVAILPGLTVFLIVVHLVAFRQFGSVGPWNPAKRQRTGWFWPDQTFKDLMVVCLLTVGLVCLSALVPAPITGPADPLDNSYAPKPEWNFLFLYEALKAFKGPWERVGTVAIPLLLVVLLFAVPFIDRNPEANPFKRPIAMLAGLLFVGVILALTIIGYYSNPGAIAGASKAVSKARPVLLLASLVPMAGFAEVSGASPVDPPATPRTAVEAPAARPEPMPSMAAADTASVKPAAPIPMATVLAANVRDGKRLFATERCNACHTMEGQGGTLGPNLTHEAQMGHTRQWLSTQIVDPASHNPATIMPAHTDLTKEQVNDLVDFLLHPSLAGASQPPTVFGPSKTPVPSTQIPTLVAEIIPGQPTNPVPSDAQSLAVGKRIYVGECQPCHGPTGVGNGPASIALTEPAANLALPIMAEYADGAMFEIITQGRQAMPAFKTLLTDKERWEVLNYIRTLAPSPARLISKQPPTIPEIGPPAPARAPAPASSAVPAPTPTPVPIPAPSPAPASVPAPSVTNVTAPSAVVPQAKLKTNVIEVAKPPVSAPPAESNITARVSVPSASVPSMNIEEGRRLFTSARCIACHTIEGKGGTLGPSLDHVAKLGLTREWIITQIRNPTSHYPTSIMPANHALTDQQLNALIDYLFNPSGSQPKRPPETPPAKSSVPPASAQAAGIQEGAQLFNSAHCIVCHTIEGIGGQLGPDLSHEAEAGRTREWLVAQIQNPTNHNPITIMYAHKSLSTQQLDDLADFLLAPSKGKAALEAAVKITQPAAAPPAATVSTLPPMGKQGPPGAAVKMIGSPPHGEILFDSDCAKCHGKDAQGGIPNPGSTSGQVPPLAPIARLLFSEDPLKFAENIDPFIQHGARPAGPSPALRMPAFGSTRALTQQEIANIEAYIMKLNGVNRAEIVNPGVRPIWFVGGTVAVFALGLLLMGVNWIWNRMKGQV
ncbi:MAG: c-type cytochrome [Candidatus Omnitrophica bacterium]|nr:c-type cytochrome [Candidatus Omnitrophota bacterium]